MSELHGCNHAMLRAIEAHGVMAACQTCEYIEVPPFAILIDPDDPSAWLNYAVPVGDLAHADLTAVHAVFHSRHRRTRFEWTHELWADMLPLMQSHGLRCEHTNPQMLCTPQMLLPYVAPDVRVRWLQTNDDLAAYCALSRAGFGSRVPVEDMDVAEIHANLANGWRYALATFNGIGVGVGGYHALDGMTELIGIATHPAFRRRGVAATLTTALASDHFERGGSVAYLFAADAVAHAVYAKIGFKQVATRMTAIEEPS